MTGSRGRVGWALAGAVLLAGFGLLYWWAVRTADGQWLDIRLFSRAQVYNDRLLGVATVARAYLPAVLGGVYLVALAVWLWRRRSVRQVLASVGVVVVSAVSARWLRSNILERPYLGEHGYLQNTFPSGHVAVTVSLVVGIVWLWNGPRLVVALLAGLLALTSAAASVLGHAHRPSDVIGSLMLVATTSCVAVAVTGTTPGGSRPPG